MRVRWLGRVPYREAWALQRSISRHSVDDYLLLLEHPPVYTLGRNADLDNVLVDPATVGAELIQVDRGGDVTFHGPGQLIGYPLVTVGPGPHRGAEHVHAVEQLVIDTLLALGMSPEGLGRLEGYPGVWVGLDDDGGDRVGIGPEVPVGPRKIAAIGVRTSRGRTTHGFALNVRTDLSMFDHIVPCGIPDRPVTSLHAEGCPATMAQVVAAVIGATGDRWGVPGDVQRVTDGASHGQNAGDRNSDRSSQGTGQSDSGSREGIPSPRPEFAGAGNRRPTELRQEQPGPVPVAFGRRAGTDRPLDRRLRRSGVDPTAGLALNERKPAWLRVNQTMGHAYLGLQAGVRDLGLVTVCQEAGCPNIYECWSDGTATFMINGSRCTRACGFCQVDTRHPLPLDTEEPDRVAEAVERMGLAHAVITCVARDDLADGGASGFASTIAAVRGRSPRTTVEVLISDCKGDEGSLQTVFDARPDVLNHNIETVARLQRAVRPSAGYARSLAVLARAKEAGLTTKSGIIVGMGEERSEVESTLADLRAVGVDIVTVGQYLRPSRRHLPVARWWTPAEFEGLRRTGMAMGFSHVQASPLTRSSYHAREAAATSTGSSAERQSAPALR